MLNTKLILPAETFTFFDAPSTQNEPLCAGVKTTVHVYGGEEDQYCICVWQRRGPISDNAPSIVWDWLTRTFLNGVLVTNTSFQHHGRDHLRRGHIIVLVLVKIHFQSTVLYIHVCHSIYHEHDHELTVSSMRWKISSKQSLMNVIVNSWCHLWDSKLDPSVQRTRVVYLVIRLAFLFVLVSALFAPSPNRWTWRHPGIPSDLPVYLAKEMLP